MKKITVLRLVACSAVVLSALICLPLVAEVNPFIGAMTEDPYGSRGCHGGGKTFPGSCTPFGMVQLSPDTKTGGDNGPGYSYYHPTIEGFSFTHMSGIGWYGEFGNFQVMPTTGERVLDRTKACSPFDHSRESAKAGYYSVVLDKYGILVELTSAPHSGIMRMTYPKDKVRRVQIDLGRRIGQKERWLKHSRQTFKKVSENAIEGEIHCPHKDGGWGRGAGLVTYTLYYYCEFSEPMKSFGGWDKETVFDGASSKEGVNLGFFAEFEPSEKPLLLRAGISFVSVEGAKANLKYDMKGFDFDAVKSEAQKLWAQASANIAVEGGTPTEREIFATALYHAMIDPRAISDADGKYRDAKGVVRQSGEFIERTVFSGWDVFRSEFPLLTLIRPDIVNDTINSMMQVMSSGARETLPVWDIFGCRSSCMLGNPMLPVIVDAWEKGIRGFDAEEALDMMIKTSEKRGNNRELGYSPKSLSCSLEYTYNDWCVAKFAEMLGKKDIAEKFYEYAKAYTNSWCKEVGWMRSREKDGSWMEWKGKTVHGQGCAESNPYQQGWFVPHDVDGFVSLIGGKDAFIKELTSFFENTPTNFFWNDYYNHANEPVHNVPYFFSAVGRFDLASKWTRHICAAAYNTRINGLCGNDDVGQMSAWYILSAIGMHPICPGDGRWYLTTPIFEKITIRLDPKYFKGGTFTIIAKGASDKSRKVKCIKLNGKVLDRTYITTKEVTSGGTLEFVF